MSAAPVLKVITCREDADCAIVALAMYLGETYEDVLRVVALTEKHQGRRGMWRTHIIKAAKLLGHTLKTRRRIDLESDYAILRLPDHAVILRNGLVIDGDGTVWDADEYLTARKVRLADCEAMVAE